MPRLDRHFWSCSCTRHRSHPRACAGGLAARVGEMISSSASRSSRLGAPSGPDNEPSLRPRSTGVGGHSGSWHHHLVQRSLVLFSVGVVLALVLNLLQVQRNVTLFPEEVIATIFSSAWWVPPCCGTAAGEHKLKMSVWLKTFSAHQKHLFKNGTSLTFPAFVFRKGGGRARRIQEPWVLVAGGWREPVEGGGWGDDGLRPASRWAASRSLTWP